MAKKRPAAATETPTKRPTDGEVGEEGTKEKVETPEVAEAEALAEEVLSPKGKPRRRSRTKINRSLKRRLRQKLKAFWTRLRSGEKEW